MCVVVFILFESTIHSTRVFRISSRKSSLALSASVLALESNLISTFLRKESSVS